MFETCKQCLQKKIAINMHEYKNGLFSSPAQAIAVSYSQVRKMRPGCKKFFKKSSNTKHHSNKRNNKHSKKHSNKHSNKRSNKK